MSVRRSIEISNYEKEQDEMEKSNFFMRTINYFSLNWFSFDFPNFEWSEMNWSVVLYIFLVLWIVFSILSIRKYLSCEDKFFYIMLSILPIVNVVLYFGDFCKLSIEKYNDYNYNTRSNVNGQGFINSEIVYPSVVQRKMKNHNIIMNKATNNRLMDKTNNNLPMNNISNKRSLNKATNNLPMNNISNKRSLNKVTNNRLMNNISNKRSLNKVTNNRLMNNISNKRSLNNSTNIFMTNRRRNI